MSTLLEIEADINRLYQDVQAINRQFDPLIAEAQAHVNAMEAKYGGKSSIFAKFFVNAAYAHRDQLIAQKQTALDPIESEIADLEFMADRQRELQSEVREVAERELVAKGVDPAEAARQAEVIAGEASVFSSISPTSNGIGRDLMVAGLVGGGLYLLLMLTRKRG